jgi:hypothetical protein
VMMVGRGRGGGRLRIGGSHGRLLHGVKIALLELGDTRYRKIEVIWTRPFRARAMWVTWCQRRIQWCSDNGMRRRARAIVWRLVAHMPGAGVPSEMPRIHQDLVVMVVGGVMLRHGVVRV